MEAKISSFSWGESTQDSSPTISLSHVDLPLHSQRFLWIRHPSASHHLTANYSKPAYDRILTIKGKCHNFVMAEWLIQALDSKSK